MDAEAAALLTTAGTTVVALMATDAWKQTRDGLVRLWHRFRPEHAEAIGRELTASRAVVASALARGDTPPEPRSAGCGRRNCVNCWPIRTRRESFARCCLPVSRLRRGTMGHRRAASGLRPEPKGMPARTPVTT